MAIAILKGITASSGKAEGPVQIIKTKADLKKFKAGSILVAEMTNPSLVPAMMLAAGVITDIGGITCHAAIVCRELGLPCIVGTKDATKKLNNSMKVFMDADKGTVEESK